MKYDYCFELKVSDTWEQNGYLMRDNQTLTGNIPASMRFIVIRTEWKLRLGTWREEKEQTVSYLPSRELAETLLADLTALYRRAGTLKE